MTTSHHPCSLPPTGDIDVWMEQLVLVDDLLARRWNPEREAKLTLATGLTWRQAEKMLSDAVLPLIIELRKARRG